MSSTTAEWTVASVRVGDEVSVNHPKWPGVWTVRKVNPTTLALDPKGGGRGLKAHKTLIRPASEAAQPGESGLQPLGVPAPVREQGLRTGAVVRFNPHTGHPEFQGRLFVVLKDGYDIVNVTYLGGDAGRHYWRVPPSWLTVVDPSKITVSE